MTVKELKTMLEKYPDDMEVIHSIYSDYELISDEDFSVVKAVNNGNFWLMRSHPTMSLENKLKEKEYLHLKGN